MIDALLRKSISLVPWRFRKNIKKIPLVAFSQRWALRKFLEGREFIHTIDAGPARGLKYPVTLPADKGVWTGGYEQHLAEYIAANVEKNDTCFDIGAWRGFFSGVMALSGASHVYSFEPLPVNIVQIKKMIDLNPGLNIELLEAAIGGEPGVTQFLIMPETSMGKVVGSDFQKNSPSVTNIEVRVESLDSLVNSGEVFPPDVIKVDVEGAELMVLRGAENVIAEYKPKWFIEMHSESLEEECVEFLESSGYTTTRISEHVHGVCHVYAFSG